MPPANSTELCDRMLCVVTCSDIRQCIYIHHCTRAAECAKCPLINVIDDLKNSWGTEVLFFFCRFSTGCFVALQHEWIFIRTLDSAAHFFSSASLLCNQKQPQLFSLLWISCFIWNCFCSFTWTSTHFLAIVPKVLLTNRCSKVA